MERKDIDTWIIDELAEYRTPGTTRNKLAQRLARSRTWVWGMTGSPTPQAPTDAFGQCKIITPHTVPKYFGHFRDETMLKVSQFVYAAKKEATQVVYKAMQPSVRYTLEDVTELPPVIERTVDVQMGPKQTKVYEEIRKYAFSAIQNEEISAVNAGAVLNKLLQASLGYVYSDRRGIVGLDNDVRLDALADAIHSTDRKVLVFVPYTHALNGVYERLTGKEKLDGAKVDGSTPKKARDHIFNLFQNTSKFKFIAAHPRCMSHGLTLTAADTVIWFGPTTSLETFEQANARVRRVGQRFKQLVLMLQGSEAERKMYARLRSKQRIQDNILDLFAKHTEAA
jgi:SNF2 family DNA or RNA helicase